MADLQQSVQEGASMVQQSSASGGMSAELDARLRALEEKIDKAYIAAERTRKYLWWTGVVTIALFVLPLIGLVFALPSFFSYYGDINSMVNTGSF